MASDWRIWVVARVGNDHDARLLLYELQERPPTVLTVDDWITVPTAKDNSGLLWSSCRVIRRSFSVRDSCVFLVVSHFPFQDADDMQSVGWIPESQAKMEAM